MERLLRLHDPAYVASFQRFCGVELVKPGTCDQETQTAKPETCGKRTQTQTKRKSSSLEKENLPATNGSPQIPTTQLKSKQQQQLHDHETNGDVRNVLTQRIQNGEIKECNNNQHKIDNTKEANGYADSCNGNGGSLSVEKHNNRNGSNIYSNGQAVKLKNGFISTSYTSEAKLNHETKNTSPAYTIKYKFLLYLAHFGAFLGNEECFMTFFPFCVWNFDSLIVRQISLLWGLVMYLGQAGKDYLCWPRPSCPPVVRLEFSYLQEFSMPSTHAMAGTAIPLHMAYLIVQRYEVPVPLAVTLALLWFLCTCFSRLFLGVHSILDLLAGIVFSLLVYASFITYIQDYDIYQQTHQFAPVMVLATAFALSTFLYPSKHRISSKGDAVQIVSAVAGFSIGFWLHYQLGYAQMPTTAPTPSPLSFPSLYTMALSVLRFLVGTIVLGIYYLPMKPASIRFFSYLYGLEKPDKTNSSVVTGYKFTVYFSMGILISFFIPLIHVWLGIPRDSFFNEVV